MFGLCHSVRTPAMQAGFVIMQIGNPDLDLVYERAVAPALLA